jgi:hypothetical protein
MITDTDPGCWINFHGAVIDRDLNAAINLERWEPNQTLPVATGIRTAVDLKGPTPKVEAAIKQLCLFV